jgi:hypothetical protein
MGGASSTNGDKRTRGYWWERDRQEDQDVGGWIILGWIWERWDRVMWTGLVWLKTGTDGELTKIHPNINHPPT